MEAFQRDEVRRRRLSTIVDILRAASPGAGRSVWYPAGNTLFVEGDLATEVHLILSGAVKLIRSQRDIRDVTLGIRGPGWLLGVGAALLDVPQPCRAVTMIRSEVRSIAIEPFRDLVSHNPQAAEAIACLLSHELLAVIHRASWQTFAVRDRLELLFRELAQSHGMPLDNAVRIVLPLTHQDLADLIVASRESVSRAMADLRRAGRIRTNGGWLMVPHVTAPDRHCQI